MPVVKEQEDVTTFQVENVSSRDNKEAQYSSFNVNEDEEKFVLDFNLVANIASLCMLVAAMVWNQIVPSSTIAFIAARFPEGASAAGWIAITPSIIGSVVQAVIGDLSDVFGRRSFLMVGCAAGILGTLLSGRANSMSMVIVGQAFNGFATACGFLSMPSLQEMIPKKLRPFAIASATLVSSFSLICGPIFVGLMIQNGIGGTLEGWRGGFYTSTGLWALTLAGLFFFYHPMDRLNPENLTVVQRLKKIDWLGIFLVAAGLTLFLLGLNYANNPYRWTSAIVLGPLVTGGIVTILFILWEWKGTSNGILPHAIFQDRNYPLTIAVRITGGFALLGAQAYIPQIAVNVFGTGGLKTAVWQLPLNVCSTLGAFVGFMLRYFKEVRWIIVGTLVGMVLGGGLMTMVKPGSNFALWFFGNAIIGLSVGVEANLLTVVSSLFTPNELIATGVCVCNSASFVGGAVAVTVYGTIFVNKLQTILPAELTKSALNAGLPSSKHSRTPYGLCNRESKRYHSCSRGDGRDIGCNHRGIQTRIR
ncbi:hypothetical protein H2198_001356 [Neophaeococcomyces mojaviensis]|uniref:Uncharacterized protein n=1 Tax=Neophaeococcomyces mojaviensis TaxID=3383035 RepID=A0ACC3AHA6_9EURO|nr:hypothetical protein H2198_001356 [Knufia sp. JES_112]